MKNTRYHNSVSFIVCLMIVNIFFFYFVIHKMYILSLSLKMETLCYLEYDFST